MLVLRKQPATIATMLDQNIDVLLGHVGDRVAILGERRVHRRSAAHRRAGVDGAPGAGAVAECDELNNQDTATGATCPVIL